MWDVFTLGAQAQACSSSNDQCEQHFCVWASFTNFTWACLKSWSQTEFMCAQAQSAGSEEAQQLVQCMRGRSTPRRILHKVVFTLGAQGLITMKRSCSRLSNELDLRVKCAWFRPTSIKMSSKGFLRSLEWPLEHQITCCKCASLTKVSKRSADKYDFLFALPSAHSTISQS